MRYVVVRGKPTAFASVLMAARSRRFSSVKTSSPRFSARMGRVDSRVPSSLAATWRESAESGLICASIAGPSYKVCVLGLYNRYLGQNVDIACRHSLTKANRIHFALNGGQPPDVPFDRLHRDGPADAGNVPQEMCLPPPWQICLPCRRRRGVQLQFATFLC